MLEPRGLQSSLLSNLSPPSSSFQSSAPAAILTTLHSRPSPGTATTAVYYELVPSAARLPTVDLSVSMLGVLLGPAIGDRHLYWAGITGSISAKLFRVGIVISLLSYFFEASIGS